MGIDCSHLRGPPMAPPVAPPADRTAGRSCDRRCSDAGGGWPSNTVVNPDQNCSSDQWSNADVGIIVSQLDENSVDS